MSRKGTLATGLSLIVAILFMITASKAQSIEYPAPPDVEKAVLATLDKIQKAAEALDADKVFEPVLHNENGALIQNGRFFLTWEEALQSTKQGFQRLKKAEYKFTRQHVSLLSPSVALAVGEGESTVTTADGRTFTNGFAQSVLLVLTDGEWKVFHSHRSFPPAR